MWTPNFENQLRQIALSAPKFDDQVVSRMQAAHLVWADEPLKKYPANWKEGDTW